MTKKQKIQMTLPIGDAEYILELVAATLRAHGVPRKKALKPLTDAAQRVLSLSVSDRDMTISPKVVSIEARRVAARLLAA